MGTEAERPDGRPADARDRRVGRSTRQPSSTSSVIVFRCAVAVVVAPVIVTALRFGLDQWYPIADSALTAVWVNDVFSAHPPLAGLPAAPADDTGLAYSFPGALQLYLLAVPVKLFGVPWGILAGMAAINTGALVTALWLVRRRIGYRAGLIACATFASVLWAIGPDMLVDLRPMRMGVIPFILFLVAAWSIADGDDDAIVPFAIVANYLVLDQLKFTVTVPVVGAVAIACALWIRRAEHRAGEPTDQRARTRRRRSLAAAGTFTVIVWVPPVVDQLAGTGNLGELLAAVASLSPSTPGAAKRSVIDSIGVVTSTTTTWPLWFRASFVQPNFSGAGPTIPWIRMIAGWAVLAGALTASGFAAWRRRDRTVITSFVVGVAAIVSWVVAAQVNPAVFSAYARSYLLAIWPLGAFIWCAILVAVVRTDRVRALIRHGVGSRVATVGTAALVVVTSAAATVPSTSAHQKPAEITDVARELEDAIVEGVPPGGPVLVPRIVDPADGSADFHFTAFFPVVLLALQKADIPFRVESERDIRYYRSWRAFRADPPNATRQLVIRNRPTNTPGYDLVAHVTIEPLASDARIDAALREQFGRGASSESPGGAATDPSTPLQQCVAELLDGRPSTARNLKCYSTSTRVDDDELREQFPLEGTDPGDLRSWILRQVWERTNSGWIYLAPLDP